MSSTSRSIAVLFGGMAIVLISFNDRVPVFLTAAVLIAALVCAAVVLIQSRGHGLLRDRAFHVSAEFRKEVERYLGEVAMGSSREMRRERLAKKELERPEGAGEETPAVTRQGPAPRASGDVLGRITENVEVLGGYREDLTALLQLHRRLGDPHITPEVREKTHSDIKHFEKTIALPFLLEDSEAVQAETVSLVEDLRRWLRHGAVDERTDEVWSPVDLHSRIEMALEKLPSEKARGAWFERHFGEIPLILTRPGSLVDALFRIFDCFVDSAGGGQAIHIRTAQRGEYAWIGIGAAPNDTGSTTLALDDRIQSAGRIWSDLGGHMATGESEVRILLPLHGPVHLFQEEVGESAGEKTG